MGRVSQGTAPGLLKEPLSSGQEFPSAACLPWLQKRVGLLHTVSARSLNGARHFPSCRQVKMYWYESVNLGKFAVSTPPTSLRFDHMKPRPNQPPA